MTDEKQTQEQADEEMINQGFQELLDSSNFLKFSACAEARSPNMPPDILVRPSTICAILGPNRFSMSSTV